MYTYSLCNNYYTANNYIRKGLPQAVDSILQTSNPDNFALVVIGRGRTSIKKNLQRKLSGKTQAVWLDHVKNPAKYYRSADVFLFPTLYDSFANVIGEALACGLPVITTQQAGGAEMILRDENGFVAKHATIVNDLSNYLEKFTDRDLCAEFSKRAPLRGGNRKGAFKSFFAKIRRLACLVEAGFRLVGKVFSIR